MRISDWSSDVCSSDLTDRPTRWPTPISAMEKLVETLVAPAPNLKKVAASSATSFVLARMEKAAAATELATMAASPRLFSSSPSRDPAPTFRSEAHTSELQSPMRISYAVFCLKKKQNKPT